MSKVANCFEAVVRMKDDEASEIYSLADQLREQDGSLNEEASIVAAVRQLIAGMTGVPAPNQALSGMAAALTNAPSAASGVTDRIAKETNQGFVTRVNAAATAGDITRNQADSLLELGAQSTAGMKKAKDELVRLQGKAEQKRQDQKEAGKSWDDADFNWQEGDPKFADLSPHSQEVWTEAVADNRANGELYQHLVDEYNVVNSLPKVDDSTDLREERERVPGAQGMDARVDTAQFQTARDAANWLATNMDAPWARAVAKRIAGFLDADVKLVTVDQNTPIGRLSQNTKNLLLTRTASGISSLEHATGNVTLFFPAAQHPRSATLLHELIHAATQRALYQNDKARTALESIQMAVARSMRGIEGMPGSTADDNEAARYFGRVVNDADELLAYAFSSPTLRKYLEHMKPDGTFRTMADEQSDDRTRRKAEDEFADPSEPNLWQRFVDWVMETLGLDPVYRPKFDALLEKNEAERNQYLTDNLTPQLIPKLEALLNSVLLTQGLTKPEDHVRKMNTLAAPVEVSRAETTPPARTAARDARPGPTETMKGLNLPDFEPKSKIATTLKDWSGGWRNKPAMLGWLTLRQIEDRFKDVPGVKEFTALSQRMGGKAKSLMAEAHGVDQDWAKLTATESADMQRLMVESTMEQMWPNHPLAGTNNAHIDKADAIKANKHAELAKRYNALSETAKRVFVNSQAKMRADWDERGKLLRRQIVDQYRPEMGKLSAAEVDHLTTLDKAGRADAMKSYSRQMQRALTNMYADLDEHAERLAQMRGPYFPLMRFGDHAVVAKSVDYTEAAEKLENAQDTLEGLNADEDSSPERIKAAQAEVKAARTVVENLKDSEKHYVVEFFESPTEAAARREQLVNFFADAKRPMTVYQQRREEHFAKIDAVAPGFMRKLQESLTANLPEKDANAIRSAVRDLYIQSMPERSALKSQLRRLNVKGVKAGEMRRSFAAAAMRSSWHLSRLEFGHLMNDQLANLRSGDSDEQRVVGGELARRLATAFQQDNSNQFLEFLSGASYMTYLGMSPSFFIMNAVQPWAISLPIMAGRFGIKRSTAELGTAFNEVAAAMTQSAREQGTWRFELNLEKFKDNGERQMLHDLFNKGIIDVTIEHDLGSQAAGNESTAMGRAMQYATLPAHHTEVLNRVMTALAAYRLARSPALGHVDDHADATKYAESVVADTHLDYSPENAPRFMRSASLGGLGRIVFQFKKYMQGMIFLHGKLIRDSFSGNADEARTARKGLGYLLGMNMAVSGAVGLPIASFPIGAIAWAISKMYPDDDQPEFFQTIYAGMKDAIGETAARALMKGLPAAAGVDVSNKIGFGGLLNPLQYVPPGKEGADYVAAAVLAMSGPAMSMVANWADALSIAKDDPTKAAIKALPRVLADPIRAMDRADRGVTNKRGETIMGPEEFGPLAQVMRAIGFEQTAVTDMYDARGAMMDARTSRDDARKGLLKSAAQARMAGDSERVDSTQAKIDDWNERHPEPGLRISGQNIQQSVKQQRLTAQELRDGVRVRKQDRELADRLHLAPAQGAAQ